MSSYVKRVRTDGKVGYVGPMRSPGQADREANAWREAGWAAEVLPVTPETRAAVKAWQSAVKASRAL